MIEGKKGGGGMGVTGGEASKMGMKKYTAIIPMASVSNVSTICTTAPGI